MWCFGCFHPRKLCRGGGDCAFGTTMLKVSASFFSASFGILLVMGWGCMVLVSEDLLLGHMTFLLPHLLEKVWRIYSELGRVHSCRILFLMMSLVCIMSDIYNVAYPDVNTILLGCVVPRCPCCAVCCALWFWCLGGGGGMGALV